MLRRLTFLLSPRWLLLYATVIAATIGMVLLGRWQLHRAHERHGDLQNYSYVLQWWAFSVFVVFMLMRVIRDAVRQRSSSARGASSAPALTAAAANANAAAGGETQVDYRRYVPPTSATDLDSIQVQYNDYLASLDPTAEPGT